MALLALQEYLALVIDQLVAGPGGLLAEVQQDREQMGVANRSIGKAAQQAAGRDEAVQQSLRSQGAADPLLFSTIYWLFALKPCQYTAVSGPDIISIFEI